MADNDREFGNLSARVAILENEQEKLRTRVHDQAQKITASAGLLGAIKLMNKRLDQVETTLSGQSRLVGMIGGASAIAGGAIVWLVEKLLGK